MAKVQKTNEGKYIYQAGTKEYIGIEELGELSNAINDLDNIKEDKTVHNNDMNTVNNKIDDMNSNIEFIDNNKESKQSHDNDIVDLETKINLKESIAKHISDFQVLNNTKQDNLISGITIKTINDKPLLGDGNIDINGAVIEHVDYIFDATKTIQINDYPFRQGYYYTLNVQFLNIDNNKVSFSWIIGEFTGNLSKATYYQNTIGVSGTTGTYLNNNILLGINTTGQLTIRSATGSSWPATFNSTIKEVISVTIEQKQVDIVNSITTYEQAPIVLIDGHLTKVKYTTNNTVAVNVDMSLVDSINDIREKTENNNNLIVSANNNISNMFMLINTNSTNIDGNTAEITQIKNDMSVVNDNINNMQLNISNELEQINNKLDNIIPGEGVDNSIILNNIYDKLSVQWENISGNNIIYDINYKYRFKLKLVNANTVFYNYIEYDGFASTYISNGNPGQVIQFITSHIINGSTVNYDINIVWGYKKIKGLGD